MLYLAIPAHNEVATIGVLLWRLRTVLAEFPREYEVVVYDDASTDDTAAVAEQYERAMPVTVLRGTTRLGYAGAVDALLRHVASSTRYPRRDAVLLLQGDFTDPPVVVPEFARRFEGGADLVVGQRLTVADAPLAVKRLFKYGHWAMRPFVKVDGVADLTASMRLVRISALREAIRLAGNSPLVQGDSWTANTDLLLRLAPHARRVESVPMEPTFGVRMRETRRTAMADTISALKWAWGARGRRAVVGSSPAETGPDERRGGRQSGRRRDEPELSVERLREKVRERDGSRGTDGEPVDTRRGRRDKRQGERAERGEPHARAERPDRSERPERAERVRSEPGGEPRAERTERPRERDTREAREPREPREPRERRPRGDRGARPADGRAPESPRRREEGRAPFTDPTLELADPFAPPRRDAVDPFRRPDTADLPAADGDQVADDQAPGTEGAPASPPAPRSEPANGMGSGDDTPDAVADASDASGEGSDQDETGEGEPRRKRRRNRRSRRGRRRKTGEAGDVSDAADTDDTPDGPDGEGEEGDRDTGDVADDAGDAAGEAAGEARARRGRARTRPPRGERVHFSQADHVDGEPVRPVEADGDDGDDGDDSDDDVAGVESMSEGAPRPRRRGRRGRRGGARRSRGRRDRGDGAADGEAPPSAGEAPGDGA